MFKKNHSTLKVANLLSLIVVAILVAGVALPVKALPLRLAPAGPGIYDDTNAHWTYSAGWTLVGRAGPYNGTVHYTKTTNATASFTFQAPAKFTFYYAKFIQRGAFQILVDGTVLTTIDPYATVKTWQNTYTSPAYKDTKAHTVKIKNISTGAKRVDIDAIKIAAAGSSASNAAVLVGAGDISTCSNSYDEATAKLLDNIPGTIFAAGDDAYPSGTASDFKNCYGPTWGRLKARTKPVPGNHEYRTSGASAYFNYFNNIPSYYAYNLGSWRVYALNSEIDISATGAEIKWLQADLAANPHQCVLAYWHTPRWSSGSEHGSSPRIQVLWQTLYNAGAELVLNGHDHEYERFAPMNASGAAVSSGMREFVVGTGGAGLYSFGTILPASQIRNSSTHGVLKLTLNPTSYSWQFIPVAGKTFTDSGSTNCR